MGDNADLHGKILSFLAGEFARKEGRQCVAVDLLYAPGNGFRDDEIRKWVRTDEPDFFDITAFVNVERLVSMIIEIAEGEADAKNAGKHRFIVRTHQHLGSRATLSFALQPSYNGADETALVAGGGRDSNGNSRPDVIASHAGQLMRINAQMFEGTIRVLGQQNMNMHEELAELRSDNNKLRRENDELRSVKEEREFQMHLTMEKNARSNAGFQKLMQIGTVVAAKIGGGDENSTGSASPLAMLIGEFGRSLRQDQMGTLMNMLDVPQKIMFMEILNMVVPANPKTGAAPPGSGPGGGGGGGPAALPSPQANGAGGGA